MDPTKAALFAAAAILGIVLLAQTEQARSSAISLRAHASNSAQPDSAARHP